VKKFVVGLVMVAMTSLGLAACGGNPNVAYTPSLAAFGNSTLSQCYMPLSVPQSYWQSIEQQYIQRGWCHAGWQPTYIPQNMYMTYYPYYSSPVFYNAYIPVAYRTSYVSYERGFGTTYRSQIATLDRTAVYRGSNGKTTTYNQIKSGGGSRSSFGTGGTRCSAVRNALLQPKYQTKGGGGFSGGGSRGGTTSGGGSRTGGSRSGSGSGSGSKTGSKPC
jgi:hypothetical protein